MDKDRRYYASKLEGEVHILQGYVNQNKATVQRFRAEGGNETISERVKKLKLKIAEQEAEIEEKLQEAREIRAGLRDAEITAKTQQTQKDTISRHNETMRIKKEKAADKARRRAESEKYYQAQIQSNRDHRQLQRDVRYHYRRFQKICDSIPSYIERNLSDMPHNKGYIWRGVWLFGKKKAEKNKPQVMFERKNKDLLLIHECDEYETRLYEKRGKNRKVLVERKRRRKIPGAPVNGVFSPF
jgi:hypothetical protein